MTVSMYRQLWLAIVASTLLALVGALLASLLSARGYLESQLSIKNTDNATALALAISQSKPNPDMIELAATSLFDSGHYEWIRVADPLGRVLFERGDPETGAAAPAWFVHLFPIRAEPGQAQISDGWQALGAVTLSSHSRFAYGALWQSAYEMMMALTLAGLVGGALGALVLGRLRRPLAAVIEQAHAITQRRFVTIDEPQVPELKQLAMAMNTTVTRLKSMFDEEAAKLEEMRREANCDALTGLANRSHFMARLQQSLESEDSAGGSLLLVRLADLAGLNIRLGRAAGDDFLCRAGEVIRQYAAPGGLAARLSGADFALMRAGDEQGAATAAALLRDLSKVAALFSEAVPAAWIGVGRYRHGAVLGTLLAGVDGALARAQTDGGNPIHEVWDEDDLLPRTAEQWSRMLSRALEARRVRLASFPVVDVRGALLHREFPLRLMLEEKTGWLPARRFLPVAERLKLTPAIDLTTVGLVLQELQARPDLPGLAINLSASSIAEPQFRKQLLALLGAQRGATSRLWIEVPEIGALNHPEAFRELCRELKALNCRVGLEHFGYHFNSIGLLHEIGIDYLKIDATFIRSIETNVGNQAFLAGLCDIAHSIGLQVLAEGVSTQAELEVVGRLGFDGATGPAITDA